MELNRYHRCPKCERYWTHEGCNTGPGFSHNYKCLYCTADNASRSYDGFEYLDEFEAWVAEERAKAGV